MEQGIEINMFKSASQRPRHTQLKKHVERREERVATMKSGSISVDGGDHMIACTVRDIHSSGARMSVMSMEGLSDSFLLIVRSSDLVARAKVAWRNENEIGVRFLRQGDLSKEEQLRRDQSNVHRKEQEEKAKKQTLEKDRLEAELSARHQAEANRQAQIQIARMKVMGLDPTRPFSEEELKSAYRKQALLKHPDQGGDPLEFQQLQDVYRILLNVFAAMTSNRPSGHHETVA